MHASSFSSTCIAQYGKQLVPVSAEEEAYLSYAVARGIKLLGFVDADSIPRHHYMKVSVCLQGRVSWDIACPLQHSSRPISLHPACAHRTAG